VSAAAVGVSARDLSAVGAADFLLAGVETNAENSAGLDVGWVDGGRMLMLRRPVEPGPQQPCHSGESGEHQPGPESAPDESQECCTCEQNGWPTRQEQRPPSRADANQEQEGKSAG
jgi:hypothetical protein